MQQFAPRSGFAQHREAAGGFVEALQSKYKQVIKQVAPPYVDQLDDERTPA